MTESRANDTLQKYNEYIRKHAPDSSQESINHLIHFLSQLTLKSFDEQEAGKLCEVLIKINRLNRKILGFEKFDAINSLIPMDTLRNIEFNKAYPTLLQIMTDSIKNIHNSSKAVDVSDIRKFIDSSLKIDKAYQRLSLYVRIVKDYEDEPVRKYQKEQIQLYKKQLIKLSKNAIEDIQKMISELYKKHSVKDLQELMNKQQDLERKKDNSPESDLKLKRIEDHIDFIKKVFGKTNEISELFKKPIDALSSDDLISKINELLKLPNLQLINEKNYKSQTENQVRTIEAIVDNETKAKQQGKDNINLSEIIANYKTANSTKENQQSVITSAELSYMNAFQESANFHKFFHAANSALTNAVKNELENIKKGITTLHSSISLSQIEEIAESKNNSALVNDKTIEKADAKAIFSTVKGLKVEIQLDDSMRSNLDLRNKVIDDYKKSLNLPEHLTLIESLGKTPVRIDVFYTYIIKDFDKISQQIRELKIPESKDKDKIIKARDAALSIILKLEQYKTKMDFLIDRVATLIPLYFTTPQLIKESIKKDLGTLTNITFACAPAPKIRDKDTLGFDSKSIVNRNKSFEENANTEVSNLYTLFMFNKLKKQIIIGYQLAQEQASELVKKLVQIPLPDLVKAIKANKLPSELAKLQDPIKKRLVKYLSENINTWSQYPSTESLLNAGIELCVPDPVHELVIAIKENKLPPAFDKLPSSIKKRLVEYVSENVDKWSQYPSVDSQAEAKITPKVFGDMWKTAVNVLKDFQETPVAIDIFDLITKDDNTLLVECELLGTLMKNSEFTKLKKDLDVIWKEQLRGIAAPIVVSSTSPTNQTTASDEKLTSTPTILAGLVTLPLTTPVVTPDYHAALGLNRSSMTPVIRTPQSQDPGNVSTDKKDLPPIPKPVARRKPQPDEPIGAGAANPSTKETKAEVPTTATPTGATPKETKAEVQVIVTPLGTKVNIHKRTSNNSGLGLFHPQSTTPTTQQQGTPSSNAATTNESQSGNTPSDTQTVVKKPG